MGYAAIDRIGHKIGKLTVVRQTKSAVQGKSVRAMWVCLCDCGGTITVSGHSLSKADGGKGGTRSCGCLLRIKPIKHGRTGTRVYKSWHMMLQRCSNVNNAAYKHYGARGISVCSRWKLFVNFYEDMGEPPVGRTLDRIDNSKGYYKENCRWATRLQQGNNRRSNKVISHGGKVLTLSQWASVTGLTTYCISGRLNRGWSVEKSLTTSRQK